MSGPIPPFLSERFAGRAAAAHGTVWNELWVERLTPWDRGGPSLALLDLLVLLPGAEKEASGVPLFPVTPQTGSAPPSSGSSSRRRPRALVPGCGRGHDVLLLAQLGWDVVGLDYSPTAIEEAKSNAQTGGMDTAARVVFERRMEAGIIRSESDPVPRAGDVTWLAGDFFARGRSASALDKLVEDEMGGEGFDLIFDYTVRLGLFHCPYQGLASPSSDGDLVPLCPSPRPPAQLVEPCDISAGPPARPAHLPRVSLGS